MLDFCADNFSSCVWLAVFLVSMVPMLESKVAIPFAMSTEIWGDKILSPTVACVISLAGSMVPAICLLLIGKLLKNRVAGFVVARKGHKQENKFFEHLKTLSQKTSALQKCVYLAGFVAFPMPFTGLYTGSLIAGFSNLCWWQGLISLLVGALVSCVGIVLICCLFQNSVFYIFLFAVAVAILFCLANGLIWLFKTIKKKRDA